jgi:DNA-binding IclR family transcriptional regulator
MTEKKSVTRSIERALEILDCFLEGNQGLTLNEIAERVSLSPSTTYRLLNTMAVNAYLTKNEDKRYTLGPKIASLGAKTEVKYDQLVEIAQPLMLQLNKKYDESISLYVIEGEHILCIERIETTRALKQTTQKGDCLALTSGASGKLLLSFASESLQKKMAGDNPFMWSAIEKIQSDGYALSTGEKSEGVSCIATPIRNKKNQVVGALTMTGLFTRFQGSNLAEKIEDTLLMARKASEKLSVW